MKFSIVTTVYNEYELLRQFIESVKHHIDPKSYDKIVVFDDYSDPKGRLGEYENFLNEHDEKVSVVLHDEYRPAHLSKRKYTSFVEEYTEEPIDLTIYDTDEPNMGHPYALREAMNHIDTDFVFQCDCDCFFLSKAKNLLFDIGKLFEQNEKVLGIGQFVGKKIDELIVVNDRFIWESRGRKAGSGNYVSQCASALRTSAWKEHGIYIVPPTHFKSKDEKVTAAALNFFHEFLYAKGFQTMNFPIFSQGYMIHLGGGSIKRAPSKIYNAGFCEDFSAPYGARRDVNVLESWHMGRYFVKMKYKDYANHLKQKYENNFDEIQESLDESLVGILD